MGRRHPNSRSLGSASFAWLARDVVLVIAIRNPPSEFDPLVGPAWCSSKFPISFVYPMRPAAVHRPPASYASLS
jgi:hypothetical protein